MVIALKEAFRHAKCIRMQFNHIIRMSPKKSIELSNFTRRVVTYLLMPQKEVDNRMGSLPRGVAGKEVILSNS